MNSHQNARTTPHLRRLMVTRVLEQGYAPMRVAEELGISVRTGSWPGTICTTRRPQAASASPRFRSRRPAGVAVIVR